MTYLDLQAVIDGGDIAKTIEILTSQADQPDIQKLQKQWFVSEHDIMDTCKRCDREVVYEETTEGGAKTAYQPEALRGAVKLRVHPSDISPNLPPDLSGFR